MAGSGVLMEDIEDDAVEATEGAAQVHGLEGDKDASGVGERDHAGDEVRARRVSLAASSPRMRMVTPEGKTTSESQ